MAWPLGFLTPRGMWHKARDRLRHGARAPLLRELIHLDPATIAGECKSEAARAFQRRHGGARALVLGGDWDHALKPLDPRALGVYHSCHAHWTLGADWAETPVYQSYLRKIEKGRPHPDCPTLPALDARYAALDAIFAQVRDSGCMSEDAEDLVTISLDRAGRPHWGPNGRHRVCIALILGLARMPARVGIVHESALDAYQALRSHRRAPLRGPRGLLA